MDVASLLAGFLAWALSVAASLVLVFGTFRLRTFLSRAVDEEALLRQGNRSAGIALGAVVLGQAILLRHAVFPSMVVLRELFLAPPSAGDVLRAVGQSALFFLIVGLLASGSIALAGWLFARMTGSIAETEEMLRDNVAVAVFYACVVLAVAVLVNEGLEDLSRSLIPYGRTGIVHLP